MDRRTFLGTMTSGLFLAPLAAEAQQTRNPYRVGLLETTSLATNAANVNALRQGLRELGYAETQQYVIEYRSADGQDARFPDLAAELVRLKVDMIVTGGTPAALAGPASTQFPSSWRRVAIPWRRASWLACRIPARM